MSAKPTVIVVGSGIAGLVVAIEASRTHDVTLITKAELGESNTRYAQGGIAAAVFADDSVASHVHDTLVAGAGLNRLSAVEVLCAEGPGRIRDLIRLGVEFDRASKGVADTGAGTDADSGADPVAGLARGLEAAHASARILHAGGDATGAAIEGALVRAVRTTASRIMEFTFVSDLVVEGEVARGVEIIDIGSGAPATLWADAVVLASGGAGQLYAHTTNPAVTTGDGVAAAYRAGAELADLEFYQFHPTSLDLPGNFLISEAVRGEGAVLLDSAGERFMVSVHPDAELAPRDVVARAIAEQMREQGGAPVRLDATGLGADFLEHRFPSISEECRKQGIDWSQVSIPITPAAHYWMGGVMTDTAGRTTVQGLYAVGEVACTGAHGANRLASNSLLESVVFAWRCVEALQGAGRVGGESDWPDVWLDSVGEAPASDEQAGRRAEANRVSAPVEHSAGPDARHPFTRAQLQRLLWDAAGVYRDAGTLAAADAALSEFLPDLTSVHGRENANLLLLGRLIVASALAREESRGAHYRSDFPLASEEFRHHLVAVRASEPDESPADEALSTPESLVAPENLLARKVAIAS
ncbi:L-aspartate oxidase [soil metagenome]